MKRLLPVLLATGALLFAACGDDSGSSTATTASWRSSDHCRRHGAATTAAAGGAATTAAGAAAASTNIQKPGECGLGTGQKATGDPIKIGVDRHQRARHRLHLDLEHDEGLLRLRERQRWHQRPSDPVHRRGPSTSTRRDRRRSRRSSSRRTACSVSWATRASSTAASTATYYASQGLLPDHRRRRPGLLREPQLLGREHGPVLLEPRRGAGRAARRGEGHDGHRHAEPARRRHHQQRRRRLRRSRTASRASA